MREIKFRAWDGEKYIYDLLIQMDSNGLVWLDCALKGDEKGAWKGGWLQEYTGLKDKNGKEIYEGDIVTCYPDDIEVAYNKIVKWADDRPSLGITVDSSGLILCENSTKYIEIIGNIYESPELLEKEDE